MKKKSVFETAEKEDVICGKEQQCYRSWLKQTKTLTRFIEADFIITMMN